MGIEQDIKQKKFKNEYEKLAVNILFTSGWVNNYNIQRFKIHKISSQQYNVLRILRGSYPDALKLSDITERMIDKMSNSTRLVDKLKVKGLVSREVNKANKRQVAISITPKGLELLATIDQGNEDWLRNFHSLSEEEAFTLNNLLDKLRS